MEEEEEEPEDRRRQAEPTNSTILDAPTRPATTVDAQRHATRGLVSGLATRLQEMDGEVATLKAEHRSLRCETFTDKLDIMDKTTLQRMHGRARPTRDEALKSQPKPPKFWSTHKKPHLTASHRPIVGQPCPEFGRSHPHICRNLPPFHGHRSESVRARQTCSHHI